MPSESEPQVRIILTTAGKEEGQMIARDLVERRLAACVNIMDARSYYRWEGVFCDEAESLLVIKTRVGKVDDTLAAIREKHPYQLPEMVVLPVISGYPPYLAWIDEETRP